MSEQIYEEKNIQGVSVQNTTNTTLLQNRKREKTEYFSLLIIVLSQIFNTGIVGIFNICNKRKIISDKDC